MHEIYKGGEEMRVNYMTNTKCLPAVYYCRVVGTWNQVMTDDETEVLGEIIMGIQEIC